jgi:cation transporter-like permease
MGIAPLLQLFLLCAMRSSAYGCFLQMGNGILLETVQPTIYEQLGLLLLVPFVLLIDANFHPILLVMLSDDTTLSFTPLL